MCVGCLNVVSEIARMSLLCGRPGRLSDAIEVVELSLDLFNDRHSGHSGIGPLHGSILERLRRFPQARDVTIEVP